MFKIQTKRTITVFKLLPLVAFISPVFATSVHAAPTASCVDPYYTPYTEYNNGDVLIKCAELRLDGGEARQGAIDSNGTSFDADVKCTGGEQPSTQAGNNTIRASCPNSSVASFRNAGGGEVNPDNVVDTSTDPATGQQLGDGFGSTGNLAEDELTQQEIQDNPIYKRLQQIVQFLTVGIGIVVTISIAIAGIQYMVSRGNPNQTAAAVNRLTQAGIALFLYIFGSVILNWLIPGGLGFNIF